MQTQTELSRAAYELTHSQTFLTGPQVQKRYQKSHVTLWRWINDPNLAFPQPLKINRLNYWRVSDLEAWETAQAERGAA